MKILSFVCICSVAISASLHAQAPATSPLDATPPEVQRLAYYIGTWKGEGEAKGGPFGPAGKLSSTMTCEWFAGHYHLVCRGSEKGPTGERSFLNIRAYDAKAKAYSDYGISSLGESEYSTGGSIDGNKLTFIKELESDGGGKPIKLRYTETQESATSYTYRAEASKEGGQWMVIAEGTYTKVK